jgi:transposase InsO family protein
MPWKEVLAPEARMQFVLAYREEEQSFSWLCRRFGISRKTGYKWLKRYRTGGVQALGDWSRRPGYCPKAYRSVWRERLIKAREARPQWGAKKLRSILRKTFPGAKRVPAVSTLALWLKRSGLARKRKRRSRRGPLLACKPLPVARRCNEVWSVDFKGWFRTRDGRRCEPLTVRDVFSRFVLTVALLPNQSDAAVRQAMRQVFRRYGLPKAIRVDNGAPFGGRGALGLSRLSVGWLRLGIAVGFIRRAHPQDNAAHEQMHRIFKADTASPPAGTFQAQKRRTTAWIAYYNCERPHEGLGQRVPAQIYWPSHRPMADQLPKVNYPRAWDIRRVRNRGHIKWRGRERFMGRAFVGELLGLKKVAEGIHEVYLDCHLIGLLYEQDLAGMRPATIARHA